ncbi:allantoate amidohydrolase [Lichenifustis flavocetrariae]|uniref:Allantoate amidohydrolase n=1 Tax=Lichenifustis flavocetrariae TaxID=2949735 RepID=A0AA42CRH6_9HYPH|nr:allantoate amidohydrolase [Lichenifustis flavocetrariae]MCW6512485.1 allantoate amidohydrolase [Lichenifustis flavocetrariae]
MSELNERNDTAGRRVMARIDALADFSSEPVALTRLYLTPEHKAAASAVAAWMTEAGILASVDAVGNVVGRVQATRPGAKTLILGSHIDTIRNAGRYDGNLGVVVAIEAMSALMRRGEKLPFAVEIIAFGDEEGVRFPQTLTGSRAVAGIFDPSALDGRDQAGVTMRDALRRFGGDPARIAALARRPAEMFGYLEVHIEQGPVLEHEGLPVGVVTAIAGASRVQVDVTGVAGHAGTVPMNLRRDALVAAAEMVGMVEALALDDPEIVATVGRVEVKPGAVNVIPSAVSFTIDLRSPSDAARLAALARLQSALEACAARRDVGLTFTPFYEAAAAPCAPELQATLARAVERQGLRVLHLPSGAGHDGLAMVKLCPIGMLFVRCAGGISHNPAESITAADADVAVEVLIDALRDLATGVAA